MERIWEKRFSKLRPEGDSSQDSADSTRIEHEGGAPGRGVGNDKAERVRPWSAAPGINAGASGLALEMVRSRYPDSREMMQLRRQVQVIEDVQRDLDLRMVAQNTGIDPDDNWLRGSTGTQNASKACAVQ
jgi:hypothetical protein